MHFLKDRWSEFLGFKGAKTLVLTFGVCLVLASILGALFPIYLKKLANDYGNDSEYYRTIYILAAIFCAIYLNRSMYQVAINKFIKDLSQNVRRLCFSKWLLSYDIQTSKKSHAERYPLGEIMARIMNDTESLRELITSGSFGIVIDIFFVISSLISFIKINLISGTFLAVTQVFCAVILIWGSKYMRNIFTAVRKSQAEVSRTLADVVGGVGQTYYLEHENYASKKGKVVFDDFLDKQLKANIWDASYYSTAESLYPIFLVLVVFIFPYSKITEAAIIFAIVDLIQRSIGPIKDIASKITNIQRAATGIRRINEFLTDVEELPKTNFEITRDTTEFAKLNVKIPFFEYSNKRSDNFCLEKIDFSMERGELVGVVGLSGSGKSTLLNIIATNVIPDHFSIRLHNSESEFQFSEKNLDRLSQYKEYVGIVSQESHIFSESLKFNISMGERYEEVEKFWEWASEKIGYLRSWDINLDTQIIPEDLSLGQKQLIAALRSCFLKKDIVLFDEISSSLDSELEEALRKAVLLIQEHSFTFVVAHRIETVIKSDNILVMDKGKIIATGKHDKLLNSSSIYGQFIEELSIS